MNIEKVEQAIANDKRFRKPSYKSMLEYVDFEQLAKDFNLRSKTIVYSECNKLEQILFKYINNNK